jgi:hypothetical protein
MLSHGEDTQKYLVSPVPSTRSGAGGKEAFRVTRRLGYDAAGETFLAYDEKQRRNFRLRLIPPGLVDDEQRNELADQTLVAGSVGHPNLDTVYWLRKDEHDNLLVASEHHPGSTLRVVLADHGPLPWARARVILLQVADALAAVHEHGIAHTDLRAGNVLLIDHSGDGDQVKLIDFGLVPILGGSDYLSECAAPEQVRGAPADARTDIYALACLAYQVLSGEAPFTNTSAFDRLAQQAARDCRPLRGRGIRVPGEVEAAILAALEPDPARRPSSMRSLEEVFERCVDADTPRPEAAPPLAARAPSIEVALDVDLAEAGDDKSDSLEVALDAALAAALPARPVTDAETKPLPTLTLRATGAVPIWTPPPPPSGNERRSGPEPGVEHQTSAMVEELAAQAALEAFPGRISRATMLELPALHPRPGHAPAVVVHSPEIVTPGVETQPRSAAPQTLMVHAATPPRTSLFSRVPAVDPRSDADGQPAPSGRHRTVPMEPAARPPSGRQEAVREAATTLARDAAVARLRARTAPGSGARLVDDRRDDRRDEVSAPLPPAPSTAAQGPAPREIHTGASRRLDPPAPFGQRRSARSGGLGRPQPHAPRPRFQIDDAAILLRAGERRRARGTFWRGLVVLALLAGGAVYAVLRLGPGL